MHSLVQDGVVVLFLAFLEAILSLDNAVVLAIMARQLPKSQQKKALTYGMAGAVVFRLIFLMIASKLIHLAWVKLLGGAYLVFITGKHFLFPDKPHQGPKKTPSSSQFWKTVVLIELADIAFAIDSILAGVGVSPKFWIVFTGGVIGLIMMRFAATFFIKVLDRFPNFETTAYLLVGLIGIKLLLEGHIIPNQEFHFSSSSSPHFWIFWSIMALCIIFGFLPQKKARKK
jgi:YkoY family integral membrane protein